MSIYVLFLDLASVFTRLINPPSLTAHLHPAKNKRDENGEGKASYWELILIFIHTSIPLPQIPWFSAFGGDVPQGQEGGTYIRPRTSR